MNAFTTGNIRAGLGETFRFYDGGSVIHVLQGNVITEWDLSTAHDMSTAVASARTKNVSAQISGTSIGGFAFRPDGTRMFVLSVNDGYVYEYDLSPGWDVTSAACTGGEGFLTGDPIVGLGFSSDGTKM